MTCYVVTNFNKIQTHHTFDQFLLLRSDDRNCNVNIFCNKITMSHLHYMVSSSTWLPILGKVRTVVTDLQAPVSWEPVFSDPEITLSFMRGMIWRWGGCGGRDTFMIRENVDQRSLWLKEMTDSLEAWSPEQNNSEFKSNPQIIVLCHNVKLVKMSLRPLRKCLENDLNITSAILRLCWRY